MYWIIVTDGNGYTAIDSIQVTIIDTSTTCVFNICEGDSVFAEGNWQTVSGTYYDNYPTNYGCDTTVITQLNVRQNYSLNNIVSICTYDSIYLAGAWQTTAGFYIDNFQTSFGCDSIVETNLIVNPVFASTDTINIFQGDSVFAGGAWQTVAGVYTDNFLSQNGCDSIVTTVLNVLTGINNNSTNSALIVKPNPSNGFISIEFEDLSTHSTYFTIEDMNGRTVLDTEIKTNELQLLNISMLADGVYILHLRCNERNYYHKLVKE